MPIDRRWWEFPNGEALAREPGPPASVCSSRRARGCAWKPPALTGADAIGENGPSAGQSVKVG